MPTNRAQELFNINEIPYYELAFGSLMRSQWDGIKSIANNDSEIADLAFFRALTCWYEKDRHAISDRRDLLFEYARGEFKTDNADDTLNRYYQRLPVRSRIRKVLRQLCTLYNEKPSRRFSDSDVVNERFSDWYEEANVTTHCREAHEMAKLTGMVGVRPIFDDDGVLTFDKLTLDKCRVRFKGNKVVEILYPRASSNGSVEYVTWTEEQFIVRDSEGRVDKNEVNKYGMIPFAWLRFGQGKKGEPLFEMTESQTDANKSRLLARVNLTYTGLAVWLGINLGEEDVVISPDHLLAFEDVREGEGLDMPPHLESISPDAQFEEIDQFADSTERSLQHEQGIPPSETSNEQTTPPSGISRVLERSELIEARSFDRPVMQKFEQELAQVVARVSFRDGHATMDYGDRLSVVVSYSEEQMFVEPAEEFEFDRQRVQDGLMSLRDFFEKWGTGLSSDMTDDEFLVELSRQKDMDGRIKEVLGTSITATNGNSDTSADDDAGNDDDSQDGNDDTDDARDSELGTEDDAESV